MLHGKGRFQAPLSLSKQRILSEFRQKRSNNGGFEIILAKFAVAVCQYRNLVSVAARDRRVYVDVYGFELKRIPHLQSSQSGNHVLAQVAAASTVDSESGQRVNCHRL
jgi:hypothetical protein